MRSTGLEPLRTRARWWNARFLIAFIGLLGLASVGFWLFQEWSFDTELQAANHEVSLKQFDAARDRFARLALKRPRRADVLYSLGVCERTLRHPDAALAAWSAIPPDAPEAPRAALLRANLLIHSYGRLTDAEALLETARQGPDETANDATWALSELLVWEGRLDEVRQLIEQAWARTPTADRATLLREHWRLDQVVVTESDVRPVLDLAIKNAPNDMRIRLVQAALATSSGRFTEALGHLDACPDDPAVWRARINWAVAAGRPEKMALALTHISRNQLSSHDTLSLRAWFARQSGDAVAERHLLENLVKWNKGDSVSWERLAVLAHQDGDLARETESRQKKAEVARALERYRWSLISLPARPDRDQLLGLARQAEGLNREFEARGWWTLMLDRTPGDPIAGESLDRLARVEKSRVVPPDASHAALVADLARFRPTASSATALIAIPTFNDDAHRAGLDAAYVSPDSPLHQIPEVLGGGVALLDFDGDGWLDVFVTQGGPIFPPQPHAVRRPGDGDRLFKNRANGTFEDVTISSGIAALSHGFGQGVTVGDYDNDGDPDLFLTRWDAYALFRNKGDGTFEDATETAGLSGARGFPTSAAFADLDNDGDLDLYVCHYLRWDVEKPPICHSPRYPDRNVSCLPRQFPAEPDHLFRNDGGRFVDVTERAGIVDPEGRGLGVVIVDLDRDGLVDIYVANDQTANLLYRNLGAMRFEEVGFPMGVACGAEGTYRAGMGVACGDLDGDGLPDLAVTNFFGESTTIYRNLGGTFSDQSDAFGVSGPSRSLLGFGIAFFDANNDGHLDLATANGHVNDERPSTPFAMPAQLLLGGKGGRLTDVSAKAGPSWNRPMIERGLALGDLDNDGRIDVLIVPQNAPLLYAHNTAEHGHSITFRLEGTTSNRDAVGARVIIESGGRRQTAWRMGGGSYESASDPRLHFGLGESQRVNEVEVTWPSGQVDRFGPLDVDRGYLLREKSTRPEKLSGFSR